jgi:hypothetical protein
MKKYILIVSLLTGISCFAQNGNENKFSKEDFLSQFGIYFTDAEGSETGIIRLQATGLFASFSTEKKNTVMEFVLSKGYTLASVAYEYKRELWKKDQFSNTVALLDSWDLNTLYTPKTTLKTLQKTDVHPWFFYFGLNSNFNEESLSIYLSSRLGFFLLKNRWDLALSYSAGLYGRYEDGATYNSDLGLMSKVYYPIRKYNISPYAGLGISYLWSEYNDGSYESYPATTNWDVPVYLGVSWWVGSGSLDFGLQIGDNSVFTVGYTFSLSQWMRK